MKLILTDGNNIEVPSTMSAFSNNECPNLSTPSTSMDHMNIPSDSIVITLQPASSKLRELADKIPGPESKV